MLGTILLIAMAQAGTGGEVAATSGAVSLIRGGKTYAAAPKALLLPGDRLETADGGGASLLLPGGGVLDLGPGASAVLGGADGRSVELLGGEARAVASGAPLGMASSGGRISVAWGILRASSSSEGGRAWAEAGSAEVAGPGGRTLTLDAGQGTTWVPGGDPADPGAARPETWGLRAEGLRMATAADSSRRSKRKLAGRATDEVARSYGQTDEETAANPEAATDEATQPNPAATTEEGIPTDDSESIGANTNVTQPSASSSISLALGVSTAAGGVGTSSGNFTDAQQDSLTTQTVAVPGNPMLPLAGNIHIVGAQNQYTLSDVRLNARERFPLTREYWSIGLGASPTSQVVTTFRTASDAIPQTIRIPRTDGYLIRFPQSNYGIRDPAIGSVSTASSGISGLVGPVPIAPQVSGATPLVDSTAIFNDRATFAIGEFALQRTGKDQPQIDIRRGDQDRRIIKSPDGNDQKDQVTLNPQVKFVASRDAKFFPELPAVSTPRSNNPLGNKPSYAKLTPLEKAGATTLLADQLGDYSRRTGRTRFVLGGRVVDITGYRHANTANRVQSLMRPASVGTLQATPTGRAARFGHPH